MLLGSGLRNLESFGSDKREIDYYEEIQNSFDVYLFEYGKRSDNFPGENIRFKNKWLQSFFAPLKTKLNLKNINGVIRTKQLWGAWSGFLYKIIFKKKLIIRCGYIWSKSLIIEKKIKLGFFKQLIRLIEKTLLLTADELICTTKEVHDYYQRYFNRKIHIVPNPFNTKKFFNIKSSENRHYDFCYVGRLSELKNIKKMITVVGDLKMVIAGDGDEKKQLTNPNLDYKGLISNDNLPELFNSAKCFISLSKTEGNPKAVYEAILCGCYPFLSDIPAHRNIVDELGYGHLVPLDNEEIIDKVDSFKIDQFKLDIFSKKFTLETIVKREVEILEKLVV